MYYNVIVDNFNQANENNVAKAISQQAIIFARKETHS